MKATQDFTLDGVTVKAGDEIKPGMFAADDLAALLHSGAVVSDEPLHNEPARKAGKGKPK